eukprot:g17809.t1
MRKRILNELRLEEVLKRELEQARLSEIRKKAIEETVARAQQKINEKFARERRTQELKDMMRGVVAEKEQQVIAALNLSDVDGLMRDTLNNLDELSARVDRVQEQGEKIETEPDSQIHAFTSFQSIAEGSSEDISRDVQGLETLLNKINESMQGQCAELDEVKEAVTELRSQLLELRDAASSSESKGNSSNITQEDLQQLREECAGELDGVSKTMLEESRELHLTVQQLAASMRTLMALNLEEKVTKFTSEIESLENRVQQVEDSLSDDEMYCSEVEDEDDSERKKKPQGLQSVRSTPNKNNSASSSSQPQISAAEPTADQVWLQKVIDGELIPRREHSERIDAIDWDVLRLIPVKDQTEKLTKWDEVRIQSLSKPPKREENPWRLWKEAVWHWARRLSSVGASFVEMGQNLVEQSFKSGFEGESAVATGAGASRDLLQVMRALDDYFCPHTRTIQSKLESEIYTVRRLDMQSPTLFLHLFEKVFIREKEINKGVSTRSEQAKVDRALKALFLKQYTEQNLRSAISKKSLDGQVYNYQDLKREIDFLNIVDFHRYKPNPKKPSEDVYFPNEAGESDVLTSLLEHCGERLAVDSLGHHAVTNSYYNQTGGRKQTALHGTGLVTQGFPSSGGTGSGGGGGEAPLGGEIHLTHTPQGGPGQHRPQQQSGAGNEEKFLYKAPNITEDEKKKRLEQSKEFKLKTEPTADWCFLGEWCPGVLKTGDCAKKHTKKEIGRMRSQFEQNFPEAYKAWTKKREEFKKQKQAEAEARKKAGGGGK